MRTSQLIDRQLGSFIGAAIGDAMGAPGEFKARDSYLITEYEGGAFGVLKPGMWTDDTAMALCLADSLIACRSFDERDVMRRWRKWMRHGHNSPIKGPAFDVGVGTRQALECRRENERKAVASRNEGNGSIMRMSPVWLAYGQSSRAPTFAQAQSKLTHGPQAAASCRKLLGAIRLAAQGSKSDDGVPTMRDSVSSSGYCIDTLEAARWCVWSTTSFKQAVLAAANLGDDADTVACVTGMIAGALYGYEAIPDELIKGLWDYAHLLMVAHELMELKL